MKPVKKAKIDARLELHGTVTSIEPVSKVAVKWLREHVASEPWQWMGTRLVVDTGMVGAVIEGMVNDGLVVTR